MPAGPDAVSEREAWGRRATDDRTASGFDCLPHGSTAASAGAAPAADVRLDRRVSQGAIRAVEVGRPGTGLSPAPRYATPAFPDARAQPRAVCLIRFVSSVTWL
jgi:hypothetical protein